MKRLLTILLLLSGFSAAQTLTSITGVVKDLSQNVVTTGKVTLQLTASRDTTISGLARFVPVTVSCPIASTGNITAQANSNVTTTSGTTSPGTSVTVTSATGFAIGQAIVIAGAGAAGADYIGSISNIVGAVFTISPATTTSVNGGAKVYTPCQVTMNTALQPTGTYYVVSMWPYQVKSSQFTMYAVTAQQDVTTIVPTPATSPAQNFADVFSNQTIGGNKIFSSPITARLHGPDPWFDVTDSNYSGGAICNGSGDDTAAIQAAIASAASSSGGGTFLPSVGTCVIATGPLSFDTSNNNGLISFTGEGTTSPLVGGTTIPNLQFTGTPSALISARGSGEFRLSNVFVNYTNSGFSGNVLDTSHVGTLCGGNGCDSSFALISGSQILGSNVHSAAALVSFDKTITSFVDSTILNGAVSGIQGTQNSGTYSNVIGVTRNTLSASGGGITGALIKNPGWAWFIANNNFEGGATGGTSPKLFDSSGSPTTNNGVLIANMSGDDNNVNAHTLINHVGAQGWSHIGNAWQGGGANSTCVELNGTADGFVAIGNHFNLCGTVFHGLTGVKDVFILGNYQNGATTFVSGVPSSGIVEDPTATGTSTSLGLYSYQGTVRIFDITDNVSKFAAQTGSETSIDSGAGQVVRVNDLPGGTSQSFEVDDGSRKITTITTNGTQFWNGSGGQVASVNTSGLGTFNGGMVVGSSGSTLNTILTGTATLTFGSITSQTGSEQTVSISGASTTNMGVFCSPRATLGNVNITWSAWVSGSNTVSVRIVNPTAGNITPNAVAWGCTVSQ